MNKEAAIVGEVEAVVLILAGTDNATKILKRVCQLSIQQHLYLSQWKALKINAKTLNGIVSMIKRYEANDLQLEGRGLWILSMILQHSQCDWLKQEKNLNSNNQEAVNKVALVDVLFRISVEHSEYLVCISILQLIVERHYLDSFDIFKIGCQMADTMPDVVPAGNFASLMMFTLRSLCRTCTGSSSGDTSAISSRSGSSVRADPSTAAVSIQTGADTGASILSYHLPTVRQACKFIVYIVGNVTPNHKVNYYIRRIMRILTEIFLYCNNGGGGSSSSGHDQQLKNNKPRMQQQKEEEEEEEEVENRVAGTTAEEEKESLLSSEIEVYIMLILTYLCELHPFHAEEIMLPVHVAKTTTTTTTTPTTTSSSSSSSSSSPAGEVILTMVIIQRLKDDSLSVDGDCAAVLLLSALVSDPAIKYRLKCCISLEVLQHKMCMNSPTLTEKTTKLFLSLYDEELPQAHITNTSFSKDVDSSYGYDSNTNMDSSVTSSTRKCEQVLNYVLETMFSITTTALGQSSSMSFDERPSYGRINNVNIIPSRTTKEVHYGGNCSNSNINDHRSSNTTSNRSTAFHYLNSVVYQIGLSRIDLQQIPLLAPIVQQIGLLIVSQFQKLAEFDVGHAKIIDTLFILTGITEHCWEAIPTNIIDTSFHQIPEVLVQHFQRVARPLSAQQHGILLLLQQQRQYQEEEKKSIPAPLPAGVQFSADLCVNVDTAPASDAGVVDNINAHALQHQHLISLLNGCDINVTPRVSDSVTNDRPSNYERNSSNDINNTNRNSNNDTANSKKDVRKDLVKKFLSQWEVDSMKDVSKKLLFIYLQLQLDGLEAARHMGLFDEIEQFQEVLWDLLTEEKLGMEDAVPEMKRKCIQLFTRISQLLQRKQQAQESQHENVRMDFQQQDENISDMLCNSATLADYLLGILCSRENPAVETEEEKLLDFADSHGNPVKGDNTNSGSGSGSSSTRIVGSSNYDDSVAIEEQPSARATPTSQDLSSGSNVSVIVTILEEEYDANEDGDFNNNNNNTNSNNNSSSKHKHSDGSNKSSSNSCPQKALSMHNNGKVVQKTESGRFVSRVFRTQKLNIQLRYSCLSCLMQICVENRQVRRKVVSRFAEMADQFQYLDPMRSIQPLLQLVICISEFLMKAEVPAEECIVSLVIRALRRHQRQNRCLSAFASPFPSPSTSALPNAASVNSNSITTTTTTSSSGSSTCRGSSSSSSMSMSIRAGASTTESHTHSSELPPVGVAEDESLRILACDTISSIGLESPGLIFRGFSRLEVEDLLLSIIAQFANRTVAGTAAAAIPSRDNNNDDASSYTSRISPAMNANTKLLTAALRACNAMMHDVNSKPTWLPSLYTYHWSRYSWNTNSRPLYQVTFLQQLLLVLDVTVNSARSIGSSSSSSSSNQSSKYDKNSTTNRENDFIPTITTAARTQTDGSLLLNFALILSIITNMMYNCHDDIFTPPPASKANVSSSPASPTYSSSAPAPAPATAAVVTQLPSDASSTLSTPASSCLSTSPSCTTNTAGTTTSPAQVPVPGGTHDGGSAELKQTLIVQFLPWMAIALDYLTSHKKVQRAFLGESSNRSPKHGSNSNSNSSSNITNSNATSVGTAADTSRLPSPTNTATATASKNANANTNTNTYAGGVIRSRPQSENLTTSNPPLLPFSSSSSSSGGSGPSLAVTKAAATANAISKTDSKNIARIKRNSRTNVILMDPGANPSSSSSSSSSTTTSSSSSSSSSSSAGSPTTISRSTSSAAYFTPASEYLAEKVVEALHAFLCMDEMFPLSTYLHNATTFQATPVIACVSYFMNECRQNLKILRRGIDLIRHFADNNIGLSSIAMHSPSALLHAARQLSDTSEVQFSFCRIVVAVARADDFARENFIRFNVQTLLSELIMRQQSEPSRLACAAVNALCVNESDIISVCQSASVVESVLALIDSLPSDLRVQVEGVRVLVTIEQIPELLQTTRKISVSQILKRARKMLSNALKEDPIPFNYEQSDLEFLLNSSLWQKERLVSKIMGIFGSSNSSASSATGSSSSTSTSSDGSQHAGTKKLTR